MIRRSIFGSKNFRNILLALAEINLKSFGVRLIGNDELCHAIYCLKRKSSIFAACQGRQPKRRKKDDVDKFLSSTQESNKKKKKQEKEEKNWNQFYEKSFLFSKSKEKAARKMGEICSLLSKPREEFQVPRQFETLRRRR